MDELIQIGIKVLQQQNSKIMRDFREIQLQRNPRDRQKTVSSLESICRKSMGETLWRLSRYKIEEIPTNGIYWFAKALDGHENFMQGIPMFGSVLAMMHDNSVKFVLVNLPASNNIIKFEPDLGARSFQTDGLYRVNNAGDFTPIVSNCDFPNSRNLLSTILSYLYVAIGNVSSFVLELSELESKIAELVVNEAGGKFSKIGKFSVGSNQITHNELRSEVLKYQNIGSAPVKTEISFCCGPTQKAPTWSPSIYGSALIAHSHCSVRGISRIKQVQELIRSLLGVPQDYKILLMNGSATGALECAFFNLLGHNNIQNFSFDVFGRRWAGELEIMLKNLQNSEKKHILLRKIDYNVDDIRKGVALNEAQFDPKNDLVLVYTGTSTGYVWDQHILNQPGSNRAVICDATSAAFVEHLPWQNLDAVAFSFQKVLGCEAGLGCLILSPNACELIVSRDKIFLAPRILRLNKDMITAIADECKLVNTISMLNLHEVYNSLHWAAKSGGVKFLRQQSILNQEIITSKMTDELEFLLPDPKTRAKALLAIRPSDPKLQTWDFINKVATIADKHGVMSIAGHPHEVPCWRFWTGPTVQNTAEGFDRFLKAFAMG